MTQLKQRSRLQKKFWRWLRNLFLTLLLIALVTAGCVYLRAFFSVRQIIINSTIPRESLRGYEHYYDSFLPFVSPQDIKSSLISENPVVANVVVEKIYPETLFITVTPLKPAVTIKVADEYILLANNGRILSKSKTKPAQLPELMYYQALFKEQIKIGDILGFKDLQIAIHFIDILNTLGYSVKRVDINSFYMIRLVLADSREILVTTEKDIQTQEYQIRSILRQFKIDGTSFKSIDARFDKPVMTK